jgi:hypothetical protein
VFHFSSAVHCRISDILLPFFTSPSDYLIQSILNTAPLRGERQTSAGAWGRLPPPSLSYSLPSDFSAVPLDFQEGTWYFLRLVTLIY